MAAVRPAERRDRTPGKRHGLADRDRQLGGIGWFGGLACTLLLIVLALTTLAEKRRRRGAAGD